MRAEAYIAASLVLLAAGGCAVLRIDDIELLSQRRGPATLAPPLRVEWTYNAGAGFGGDGPVVVGDHILVATRNGDLHAISVQSGQRAGFKSFGDALEAAPLVAGKMLYVPVDMGRRAIYAYDLERSAVTWRWQGEPISMGLLPLETGFVSVDVRSVVRRHEGLSITWTQQLGDDRFVHARPLSAAGLVIVADDLGTVRALSPDDGSIRWTTALGAPVYNGMAAHADRIYVSTTRGKHFALEAATGSVLWDYALSDSTVRIATATADSTTVVFGATDGTVSALDALAGTVAWRWVAPDAIVAAPYMNEHAVYVGSMGSMVYALDRKTGSELWQEQLRGRIKSNIVGYDDFLVVLSGPRYVYLLKADEAVH